MKLKTLESKIDKTGHIPLEQIPKLSEIDFNKQLLSMVNQQQRVIAFFLAPKQKKNIYAVLSDDVNSNFNVLSFEVSDNKFSSITPQLPQLHLFEREIYEQHGVGPVGHPWLKPVRFPLKSSYTKDSGGTIGEIDFFNVKGDEIHQVAVGPVHAGIIEPGHFRFQCHGEDVFHLEISLGFQHRGIEQQLINGPYLSTPYVMEVVAGDTSIAHSYAYCKNIEQLNDINVPLRAEKLRAVALELERCANHIGDLGGMAADVAYLPTMSYCGRIRGDFLNITAIICGNRFGRGLLTPGGVKYDISNDQIKEILNKLEIGRKDFLSATSLLWDSPSILSRFEGVGNVSAKTAQDIGMVGLPARASGLHIDSRINHPSEIYKSQNIKIATNDTGDVFARAKVRWDEVLESIKFIKNILLGLDNTENNIKTDCSISNLPSEQMSISICEGWRGEVCHIALTNKEGHFNTYKIIDPSFHNWFGLSMALREEGISDFPICNKSFSLSYCGFDL